MSDRSGTLAWFLVPTVSHAAHDGSGLVGIEPQVGKAVQDAVEADTELHSRELSCHGTALG